MTLANRHGKDGYDDLVGDRKLGKVVEVDNGEEVQRDNDDEGEKVEPHVEYYGGEDEAPEISKSLSEMVEIDMGEEYVYLWFMGEWNCYSVRRRHDEHWNVIDTNISPVIIPQENVAA